MTFSPTAPVGNTNISHYDVIVIGSGAGGGSIAHVLAKGGLKVLVLEAGSNWFSSLDDPNRAPVPAFSNDEVKFDRGMRSLIVPHPVVEPRTWRTNTSKARELIGEVNALPKTVGGGSVHADLKMPRLNKIDFHLGGLAQTWTGTSFADWPVDYDVLEPYYEYAERMLGVQGLKGANPFEETRKTDFPMPPGVPMYCAVKAAAGAETLGYKAFPYPTAVNSQPYDGRPACNDCGMCSGYGCPSNAKGSSAVTVLRKALLTGNCTLLPQTRASRLLMNGTKDTVTGLEALGPDGKKVTYTADRYVLAASPIEDVRLLMLSGDALGNSSDQVGRNLTFHYQTIAIGLFEERIHGDRGRAVTHGIMDFRGTPNSEHGLGGILELSSSTGIIGDAKNMAMLLNIYSTLNGLAFDGARFKNLMRQSPMRDHLISFTFQAEDAPQPINRVDLDPEVRDLDGLPVARVTYKNHAFELTARDHYAPKFLDIYRASGAKWAAIAPADAVPASSHIMGTLRFGDDPATSVCNAQGRFHDIGNLYAADGALFPTSTGMNPTMTIMTLAMYVGANMVNPTSPLQVLAN